MVNIQGNKYGGSCCVNLGIHPLCLPIEGTGKQADPKKLKEYECVFRRRLAPGPAVDKWWKYDGLFSSSLRSSDNLIETYFKHGETYFSRYSTVDSLLDELSLGKLMTKSAITSFGMHITIPHAALVAARIYACRGVDESKEQFAQFGLEHVGPAIGLKKLLSELL